jgi:hypothetical protein
MSPVALATVLAAAANHAGRDRLPHRADEPLPPCAPRTQADLLAEHAAAGLWRTPWTRGKVAVTLGSVSRKSRALHSAASH